MKILIIEDEPKVAAFLNKGLQENGYETEVAHDGLLAKKNAIKNNYDLVLMDVVLPGINGVELCKAVKREKPGLPVLMLTALGTTDDKLAGFDAGADDYLVKPFEFKELLARIKALTKRLSQPIEKAPILKVADLELDLNRKVAIRGKRTIDLTAKEFALLEYFMINKNRVLTRANITEKVWEIDFDTGTNIVDVYVNMLRKKIDNDFELKLIHTKVGMGYMFGEG